jgi:hypothetical protein
MKLKDIPDYVPSDAVKYISRKIQEYQQDAYKYRGELINAAINLECALDELFASFFSENEEKRKYLQGLVFTKVGFMEKENLCEVLIPLFAPKFHAIHPEFAKKLKAIRELRNTLAHTLLDTSVPAALQMGGKNTLSLIKKSKKNLPAASLILIPQIKMLAIVANEMADDVFLYLHGEL